MSWAVAAVAAVGAATTVYSADQSRKNVHSQMDAQIAAQQADARQAAEAETAAAVSANARTADSRRRRRASSLGGEPAAPLAAPVSGVTVLGGGAGAPRPTAASPYGGNALGAGALR